MCHVLAFHLKKPRSQFDRAMLIISIDVDVGNSDIGRINGGQNDLNVHNFLSEARVGDAESGSIPYIIDIFDFYGVAATFAIRGQLTELSNSVIDLFLSCSVRHECRSPRILS